MNALANIFLLFVVFLAGLVKSEDPKPVAADFNNPALNTAARVNYLSPMEKEMIFEINRLRSNPSEYAAEFIAPLAGRYQRRLLYYPGDKPLLTKEGVSALKECVRDLKRQKPLPILYPSLGLSRAARDHVKDQSKTGEIGHYGSDYSKSRERIERYGTWKVRIAENIAYGGMNARQIVIYLLIDDGIKDRGHRTNFLHPDFKRIGVAAGSHPDYGNMTVMEFAANFSER